MLLPVAGQFSLLVSLKPVTAGGGRTIVGGKSLSPLVSPRPAGAAGSWTTVKDELLSILLT